MDDYASRIHLVLEYIRTHLEQDLHLAQLAQVACFSPCHFQRVFAAIMDETPSQYLRRMRLEAAAQRLMMFPPRPMSQIALECGFKSQSLLARAFRAHFGMSASQWRQGQSWQFDGQSWHLCPPAERLRLASSPELLAARQGQCPASIGDLQLRQLPAYRWAYCWCHGDDQTQLATIWSRVQEWAREQWGDEASTWRGASRWSDDPSITPLPQRRYEAGLLIADDCHVGRQQAVRHLPAGQYLVLDFRGSWQQEAVAAEYVFNYWLPRSNWALDDRAHYCLSEPFAAAGLIQWCIPVRRSRAGPRRLYQVADFSPQTQG